jgi:hypothetical protein
VLARTVPASARGGTRPLPQITLDSVRVRAYRGENMMTKHEADHLKIAIGRSDLWAKHKDDCYELIDRETLPYDLLDAARAYLGVAEHYLTQPAGVDGAFEQLRGVRETLRAALGADTTSRVVLRNAAFLVCHSAVAGIADRVKSLREAVDALETAMPPAEAPAIDLLTAARAYLEAYYTTAVGYGLDWRKKHDAAHAALREALVGREKCDEASGLTAAAREVAAFVGQPYTGIGSAVLKLRASVAKELGYDPITDETCAPNLLAAATAYIAAYDSVTATPQQLRKAFSTLRAVLELIGENAPHRLIEAARDLVSHSADGLNPNAGWVMTLARIVREIGEADAPKSAESLPDTGPQMSDLVTTARAYLIELYSPRDPGRMKRFDAAEVALREAAYAPDIAKDWSVSTALVSAARAVVYGANPRAEDVARLRSELEPSACNAGPDCDAEDPSDCEDAAADERPSEVEARLALGALFDIESPVTTFAEVVAHLALISAAEWRLDPNTGGKPWKGDREIDRRFLAFWRGRVRS